MILRFLLSGSLVISGVAKMIDATGFSRVLKYSFGCPEQLSILIASALPFTEIFLGAALIVNATFFVGLIGIRVLLGVFVLFHGWNFFVLGSRNCYCYGQLLPLDDKVTSLITLFLFFVSFFLGSVDKSAMKSQEKVQTYFLRNRTMTEKGLLILTIVFMLGIVEYNYQRISSKLREGLVSSLMISNIQNRVEELFRPYYSSVENDKSMSSLLIFFSNPNCNLCLQELMYWNETQQSHRVNIIPIFPTKMNIDLERFKNLYKLRFNIHTIDDPSSTEFFGSFPPLVSRVLFSSNGKLIQIKNKTSNESEIEFKNFLELVDKQGILIE